MLNACMFCNNSRLEYNVRDDEYSPCPKCCPAEHKRWMDEKTPKHAAPDQQADLQWTPEQIAKAQQDFKDRVSPGKPFAGMFEGPQGVVNRYDEPPMKNLITEAFQPHVTMPVTDEMEQRRAAKRWEQGSQAGDLPPLDAVKRFLAEAEAGSINTPKHVIVIYATEPVDGNKWDSIGFYQCGQYGSVEQIGLMEFAKDCVMRYLQEEK